MIWFFERIDLAADGAARFDFSSFSPIYLKSHSAIIVLIRCRRRRQNARRKRPRILARFLSASAGAG